MYKIDYNSYRSVASFGHRVRFLVLHYTAQNFADSVKSLTGKSVSAHYLVPDPTEATYQAAGFSGVRIFNLVDENERAWHAGTSQWGTRSNINDTSIGIEIVNLASGDGGNITFPPFNPQQIEAVTQLAQNILQRYPDISPVNVVAHSDIAPGRKSDPVRGGQVLPVGDPGVLLRDGIGVGHGGARGRFASDVRDGPRRRVPDSLLRLCASEVAYPGAERAPGWRHRAVRGVV